MPAKVIENKTLSNRLGVYRDRNDAGECLAKALKDFRGADALILAIPSGGVPVGLVISSRLDLPFDLLIIKKIPVPGNTESGFGAVSLEGDIVLNEPAIKMLGLSPDEIEELARPVHEELRFRNRRLSRRSPQARYQGQGSDIS